MVPGQMILDLIILGPGTRVLWVHQATSVRQPGRIAITPTDAHPLLLGGQLAAAPVIWLADVARH